MKILIKVMLSTLIFSASANAVAQSAADREAVNLVMQNFIRFFETSDEKLLRSVFRGDGALVGYSEPRKQVSIRSFEEWTDGFTGTKAADEEQRKRSFEILDVSETGALSKVVLDYPSWKGIDYIALSKIDGQWMIVSKSWSGTTPTAANSTK